MRLHVPLAMDLNLGRGTLIFCNVFSLCFHTTNDLEKGGVVRDKYTLASIERGRGKGRKKILYKVLYFHLQPPPRTHTLALLFPKRGSVGLCPT